MKLFLRGAGKPITSFPPELSLSFSSFTDIQDIPLPCLAGPILNVYTTSQVTEDWLGKYLLNDTYEYESDEDDAVGTPETRAPWWAQGREQSDLGILLRVDGHASVTRFRLQVKEILLYAAIPGTIRKGQESLITPPGSSSPNRNSDTPRTWGNDEPRAVQIFARLLYSGFPWSRDAAAQLHSTDIMVGDEAQFITPPNLEPQVTSHVPQENMKRRKVDALFEEAARENKRSRKRGGENVAHIMAKGDRPSPVLFPHGLRELSRGDSQDGTVADSQAPLNAPTLRRNLSRSKSISSLRDLEDSRPSSRHSNPAINDVQKRSSLYRVSSMTAQDDAPAPSPATEGPSRMEAQNRNALTRVVMAGLRLYGFQAKKKPLALTTDHPTSAADPDEEYKLLYHQTFKAAAFVFRKQISVQWLSQPLLREVVDKLLGMFCVDPMKEEQQSETFMPSMPKNGGEQVGFGTVLDVRGEAKRLNSELLFRKVGAPA